MIRTSERGFQMRQLSILKKRKKDAERAERGRTMWLSKQRKRQCAEAVLPHNPEPLILTRQVPAPRPTSNDMWPSHDTDERENRALQKKTQGEAPCSTRDAGRRRSRCQCKRCKRKAITAEATIDKSPKKKQQKHATPHQHHMFPPERECVVCLDPAPAIVLLPCGHQCICETCCAADKVQVGAHCPICRQTVETRELAGSGA